MAKKPAIQWKIPADPLNVAERVVLAYLEKKDSESGIERTNQAVAHSCFPGQSYGSGVAGRALRVLNVMGLVECVRRFGVVYWRRVREGEDFRKGNVRTQWVNTNANDVAIFKSDKACTAFQVMCVAHPTPVTVARISSEALGGESRDITTGILNALVVAGFAKCNEQDGRKRVYWPTVHGLRHFDLRGEGPSRTKRLWEYLRYNKDRPGMCRYEVVGREFFKMEGSITTVTNNVNAIIKDMLKRGTVIKEKHPVEGWVWLKLGKPYNMKGKENA